MLLGEARTYEESTSTAKAKAPEPEEMQLRFGEHGAWHRPMIDEDSPTPVVGVPMRCGTPFPPGSYYATRPETYRVGGRDGHLCTIGCFSQYELTHAAELRETVAHRIEQEAEQHARDSEARIRELEQQRELAKERIRTATDRMIAVEKANAEREARERAEREARADSEGDDE